MDVKTLSTIIGHVSSATTLNVYAHVTDDMQRQAAAKIDRGIGRAETPTESSQATTSHTMTDFKPKRGRIDIGAADTWVRPRADAGTGATLWPGPTEQSALGTSTLILRRSAKSCWRQ